MTSNSQKPGAAAPSRTSEVLSLYRERSWRFLAELQETAAMEFVIGGADGGYLWNLERTHRLLDCGNAGGVHSLGHRNPELLATIRERTTGTTPVSGGCRRPSRTRMTSPLLQARIDLAAVLRWAAHLGYQQGICNHFSVLAPHSERLFLVNPEGLFWSEVTASSLLLCDLDGGIVEGAGTVELSAFSLHAPIHRRNQTAKAVLHTYSPYATALCLIRDARVEPVFLAGLQFFGKIAYDDECHGAAFSVEEGEREAALLGEHSVLMMRNHGPIVVGPTIAAVFDAYADKHLTAIKRVVDCEEPEYSS